MQSARATAASDTAHRTTRMPPGMARSRWGSQHDFRSRIRAPAPRRSAKSVTRSTRSNTRTNEAICLNALRTAPSETCSSTGCARRPIRTSSSSAGRRTRIRGRAPRTAPAQNLPIFGRRFINPSLFSKWFRWLDPRQERFEVVLPSWQQLEHPALSGVGLEPVCLGGLDQRADHGAGGRVGEQPGFAVIEHIGNCKSFLSAGADADGKAPARSTVESEVPSSMVAIREPVCATSSPPSLIIRSIASPSCSAGQSVNNWCPPQLKPPQPETRALTVRF